MGVVGYLDAGSGSMLVGAVAAAGAGVAVAAKVGWRRVTGKLTGKKPDAESVDDVAEETEASTATGDEPSTPTESDAETRT